MRFIRLFILALTLLPFITFGQLKNYSLYGTVKAITGEIYPYHVVFNIKGSTLSGYSVTTQLSGVDYKAQITGTINKRKHTIRITEIKALDHVSTELCLFDANLTYKLAGNKFIVTGSFIGRNASNAVCGEGTVDIEEPNTPTSIFYVTKKVLSPPQPEKPKTDTILGKEPPLPPNTITEGVQKIIDWITDTCVLEVWDGGVIDGDVVTILYNDIPVLTNYTLEKKHKRLRIPITKKTSAITITAIDEGANPPNTADILLIDGDMRYKVTAYNSKGKKAVIVLNKK